MSENDGRCEEPRLSVTFQLVFGTFRNDVKEDEAQLANAVRRAASIMLRLLQPVVNTVTGESQTAGGDRISMNPVIPVQLLVKVWQREQEDRSALFTQNLL